MILDDSADTAQTHSAHADDPLALGSVQTRSRHYRPAAQLIPSVLATLGYLQPTPERPYNYAYEPPAGAPWENYTHDRRPVSIYNGRCTPARTSVDLEGYELWNAPCATLDFSDRDAIVQRYYPELVELALAATGAKHAYVFDHLVREREANRNALGFGRTAKGAVATANGQVHNDYTEASGRKRLALILGDAAADAAFKRYSIINIWRSIKAPVLDTPLAVCDARTIAAQDLVDAEVRYPRRTGEIYLASYSPKHRWTYFPAMDLDEALVFKQYDSQLSGVARYTPHAAFDHPHAPDNAVPRVSIEARCLVVYE